MRASAAPYPTISPSKTRGAEEGWLYFYDGDADAHEHEHSRQTDADKALARRYNAVTNYVSLMRYVGEMACVIGFDGPVFGAHLPVAHRRSQAAELVVDALRHPEDHWVRLPPEEQARYRAVADEIASMLLPLGESFVK